MSDYLHSIHFPRIGMRLIKSVVVMLLCFAVYYLRGRRGIPFYSAIAALQCIQPYHAGTKKFARNRFIGTVAGTFWGILLMLVMHYLHPEILQDERIYYAFVCLLAGMVMYTTVVLNVAETAYFTAVIFLGIGINHAWDAAPWAFIFNRVIDTTVGIVLGIAVNEFHLPRVKHKKVLYVTGIDNTLTQGRSPISDYSRIELNRIIDEGANITVATRQTPATIRENLEGVRLPLPVVVMDGAALFDMKQKRYLETTEMTESEAKRVSHFLDAEGVHYFTNKIIDDLLINYYGNNMNEVEREVMMKLRISPYRNYVERRHPIYEHVVYIFLIQPDEKCNRIYEKMLEHPWTKEMLIVKEPMNGYPGYTFLKIYSPRVDREAMIEKLRQRLRLEEVLIFGCGSRYTDVKIRRPDKDALVKQLKKHYEPVWLPWRRH